MLTEDQQNQIYATALDIKGLIRPLVCFAEEHEPKSAEMACVSTVLSYILPEIDKITELFQD